MFVSAGYSALDTCVVVGGRGTADTSDVNGGMYLDSLVSWTQMQTSTGGFVDSAMDAAASNNGSSFVRITKTGKFDGALAGIYVYCDFASVYTDGRYRITAVDASDNYIDIALAYTSDATVTMCRVGGGMATIKKATQSTQCYNNNRVIKMTNNIVWNVNDSGCVINAKRFNPTQNSGDHPYTWINTVKFQGVSADSGEPDLVNKTEIVPGSGVDASYHEENVCFDNYYIHGGRHGFTGGYGTSFNSFKRLHITDMTGQGFYLDDACYIYGCEISHMARCLYGENANGVTIEDCYIHNTGSGADNFLILNGSATIKNTYFRNNVGDYTVRFNNGSVDNCVFFQDSVDQIALLKIADQYTGSFTICNNTFYGDRVGSLTINAIQGTAAWDNAVGMHMSVSNNIIDNCDTAIVITSNIKGAYYDGNNISSCNAQASRKVELTRTTTYDHQFTSVSTGDLSSGNANIKNYIYSHLPQKWIE